MSTAIAKNFQVGTSGTATDNFTIRQPATPDGTVRIANGNSGTTTDLVTVTSAGNVGIGTSSPTLGRLQVNRTGTYLSDAVANIAAMDDTAMAAGVGGSIGLGGKYTTGGLTAHFAGIKGLKENGTSGDYGGALGFYTSPNGSIPTERARIDSSGNLLVGCTAIPSASVAGISLQATRLLTIGINTTANTFVQQFFNPNGVVGSITLSGSAAAFNTSSDYRLKNITGPITNSGAYIDSLNPVEGTWKADGSTFVGLIAHEVQEASRTTVATGTKDGEQMQGMDYSSAEIIANLIAEVKSLRQRLAALESN